MTTFNERAVQYWRIKADDNPDEKTVKVNPQNDYTDTDASFILEHTDSASDILDLASGTGLTLNKYYENIGHIDAVELFPELSKFIVEADNVDVYNADIAKFEPRKQYDAILMFGIVQYFNEDEIRELYSKYKDALKPSGKLLIKNQFGVNGDVEVSGVSEELQTEYLSQYRHIDKEQRILRSVGFGAVRAVDIYPPEANRWENTHFYAIVATLNQEDVEK